MSREPQLPDDLARLGVYLEAAASEAVRRRARRQAFVNFVGAVVLAVPFALAVAASDLSPGDAFRPPPAVVSLALEPPTNGFQVPPHPRRAAAPVGQALPGRARLRRVRQAATPHRRDGKAIAMAVRTMAPVAPRRGAERARTGRLIHDSLGLLSSKWAVDVLLALGDGTRRYHQLLADLEPISEKVLTQTLRAMERDGLVGRRVHPEVPPRVEYALTPLGASLAGPLKALGSWSLAHGRRVEEARGRFDERLRAKRAACRRGAVRREGARFRLGGPAGRSAAPPCRWTASGRGPRRAGGRSRRRPARRPR